MIIKRKSMVSGIERCLDLPVTQEQIDAWENGELIQNAMPDLTPDQREFIKTGTTAEEWDETFGEEENALDWQDDKGFPL